MASQQDSCHGVEAPILLLKATADRGADQHDLQAMFFLRHPLVAALRAWVELLAFSIPRSLTQYTLHLMSFVPTSCTQLEFHPKSAGA